MRLPFAIPPLVALATTFLLTSPAAAQPSRGSAPAGASQDAVARAQEHLRIAMAAAQAKQWEKAAAEFKASNDASPSVIALDGLANANYQLHRDKEASASYRALLALAPEIPEGNLELKREWERMRLSAQERLRDIDRRNASAPPADPKPAEPKPAEPKPKSGEDEDKEREDRQRARDERRREKEREKEDDDEPVRTAKNVVFVEGLGNGLVYSVNYERLFEKPDVGLRIGFSYMSLGASGNDSSVKVSWIAVPLVASWYVGGENHKLQLGIGATMLSVTSGGQSGPLVGEVSGLIPAPTAVFGYRYIPARGGFAFSIGFTPLMIVGDGGGFLPWGGISFGGVF